MKKTMFLALASFTLLSCSTSKHELDMSEKMALNQGEPRPNQFWWPNIVDLSPLRQHAKESNPLGDNFDYAKEFEKVDLKRVKIELSKLMKQSQDWWPADFGHYGPFFIRMAWHSAGTYRTFDGRGGAGGGQQRFEPLNSWPDNVNLDKARRLLWPIKKKYGRSLSWADLMVLAGNVALEDMGFKTFGFAGGRADDWEPEIVYWGPESKFLDSQRHNTDGKLKKPFGATQMGLIYVNPEGPDGKPDFALAAKAIREAFGRMAMNDEETVALIAGGHTFGKAHGAKKPAKCVGAEPAAASTEEQGMGWKNTCGSGKGKDSISSGLEGAWTTTPTQWGMQYLQFLYAFEWKKVEGPGGAIQWKPTDESANNLIPDAHDAERHAPMMFTTDLALRFDSAYGKITKRFLENPKEFEQAFAKAWFKLTHRDMGPSARYAGKEIPKETLSWQDPIPALNHPLINSHEVEKLKKIVLKSGLTVSELVRTAWASAVSFRSTDMRGGANGARIRLAPQKDWPANNPAELSKVISKLEMIQKEFNKTLAGGKKISLADLIVLSGHTAIEEAAKKAGVKIKIDFVGGRMDADQENTDVDSFSALEPTADGFRNYYARDSEFSPVVSLIDRANMLSLSVPEMTVLIGGLRALDANSGMSKHGVFTQRPGALSPDFFVNLYDMSTEWVKSSMEGLYEGRDRKTGTVLWTATPVDLVFGSNAELRAIGEVYASDDSNIKFVEDFAKAWKKVMTLDRFDLH